MSLETTIYNALKTLVSNRVWPDVAKEGTALPRIVYQQIGGDAFSFLEGGPVGKRNATIQVSCWATTRQAASDLSRSAEDALVGIAATPLGAMAAVYEQETQLYGAQQDFSIFY